MRIDYHEAVEGELTSARDYYEERSQGLGREFIDEFERQVFLIATMPGRWKVLQRDTRRALMKRFPYVIYFRIIDGNAIRITVVKHKRRHPGYGSNRT